MLRPEPINEKKIGKSNGLIKRGEYLQLTQDKKLKSNLTYRQTHSRRIEVAGKR